jgi:CRP-like cAMP-binding protein
MGKKQVQEPRAAYISTSEEAVEDITVAEMTAQQLKMLIRSALKEALQEVLGDPDIGLELRPEFEERLRQAVAYVASGGRLLSLEELAGELEGPGGV